MLKYVVKRLLTLIPMLVVLSFVVFVIIQLPPGDYLTTYINNLRSQGTEVTERMIRELEDRYNVGGSFWEQYWGWFTNLLQGDLGYSFKWNRSVNSLLEGRLGYTFGLSLSSVLIIWVIAFPMGFYSATHRYSPLDYSFTAMSFFGMSVPEFFLALCLLFVNFLITREYAGGLYSTEFQDAPFSFAKFVDLLKHIWLPFLVSAITGTANLFKTFRANLIDELSKPYVKTARAKGVPYRKLLIKYPVRIALIPFVSTVGWMLPGLISGSTVVGIVMNLPTVGPLLTNALKDQDMYLAGSIVLILGALSMIGTVLSDILLAVTDPRIRHSM